MKVIKSKNIYIKADGPAPSYTAARLRADYPDVERLSSCLSDVEGQSYAVQAAKEYLFGINNRENSQGVGGLMTFIGAPAVGKTFMGEKIAEALKRPCLKLDMGAFSDKEIGLCELFGVQPSYKSASEGLLTSYVEDNPVCVVLLDELEKAHPNVQNRFLSIFDRGCAIDMFTSRNVSFRDVIIIVTSNLGSSIYDRSLSAYNLSAVSSKTIINALKSEINPQTGAPYLSSALISRLARGRIVLFNKLRPEVMRRIVVGELKRQGQYYREKYGVTVKTDAEDLAELLLLGLGEKVDVRETVKCVREFFEVNFERLAELNISGGREAFTQLEIAIDKGRLSDGAKKLFFGENKSNVLICCAEAHRHKFSKFASEKIKLVFADENCLGSVAAADLSAAIIDIDEESRLFSGRLFGEAAECDDFPIYVYKLKDGAHTELRKFMDKGATDCRGGRAFPREWIKGIFGGIDLSALSKLLFRENKIVKFDCEYRFKKDAAVIDIVDIDVVTAKDAEDMDKFVSARQIPDVRLGDIYGADGAKREIAGITEVLRNFKKYRRMGMRPPRGILMHGEPGVGKTMLAKALAHEAGVQFMQCNASEFMQKYTGEGAKRIREIFAAARRYSPSIVFIDEIDTFAKSRQNSANEGGAEILNALLSEMDGFADNTSTPVFVVAATNFNAKKGETALDPALLRRFDRQIEIELPDLETRKRYLNDKVKKYPSDVSQRAIDNIAKRSIGWSLGELDNVVQNALRSALCGGAGEISDVVLNEAFETYLSGDSKARDGKDLRGTAFHEAGHAVVAAKLGIMPLYATISARSDFGGYVYYGDERITKLSLRDSLDRICIMMAGRAGERAELGEDGITSGISGDLKSATELATSMVCDYGMDDLPLYIEPSRRAGNADVSARVAKIIKEQSERAEKIIVENRQKLGDVAGALLDKVSLDEADLRELLS